MDDLYFNNGLYSVPKVFYLPEEALNRYQKRLKASVFECFQELPVPDPEQAFEMSSVYPDEFDYMIGRSWHDVYLNREVSIHPEDFPWITDAGFLYLLPALALAGTFSFPSRELRDRFKDEIVKRRQVIMSIDDSRKDLLKDIFTEWSLVESIWTGWKFDQFCCDYFGDGNFSEEAYGRFSLVPKVESIYRRQYEAASRRSRRSQLITDDSDLD